MTNLNANAGHYSQLVQRGGIRQANVMKRLIPLLALAAAGAMLGSAASSAHAAQGAIGQAQAEQAESDQGKARKEMRAGNQLSLRQIERRILPQMDGEYLGPAYDSTARAYRLKFIKDGRVTYVDVDARTGRVIRRSR